MTTSAMGASTIRDRLDLRLLGQHCPSREKLSMHIIEADADHLDVTLTLPLDPAYPDEKAAIALFEEPRLAVRYTAEMDLRAERQALAKKIEEMYRSPEGEKLRSDDPLALDELRRVLRPLARQGKAIFYRLFWKIDPRGFSEKCREPVCKAVQSALSRPQLIVVESHVPLFPWAFIYDDVGFDPSDLSTLKPERFWGFRHEIQEQVEGTSRLSRLPQTPKIITAICTDVDRAGHHWQAGHPFKICAPSVVAMGSVVDLGNSMGAFEGDCLYFYGHADQADPPVPDTSWIKLRGVELTVSELESRYNAPQFYCQPVVAFLNGCRTTPLNLWNAGSLVGFLCKRGNHRACYIVTTAAVPEGFAAEFARVFWNEFLIEKVSLGTALLTARNAMLEGPTHSPLGLVYTFFGRLDTHLEMPEHAS